MKQKFFPEDFSLKRSIVEFSILPNADVGIIEELYYITICFKETVSILVSHFKNKKSYIK